MRIMVVQSDRFTSEYVGRGLAEAGHVVVVIDDGRNALLQGLQGSFDAIIIDRLLPGLDGLSVVKGLRAAAIVIPVIFLAVVSGIDDRVEGLEAGADAYMDKPFAFLELLARVEAVARRPRLRPEKTVFQTADLELDVNRRNCTRHGRPIDLLPKEFALLEYLMRNEGRVVTRTMLLESVWNFQFNPQSGVVETLISRLRAKVDKPFEVHLLHTVRRYGYSLHA
jgi:two-component system OmpR family response regulator